jgi:Flp pilus assembly protein CpaB
MVLAGLLLFVATFLLLRDRETTYRVAVAATDIRAGTAVTLSDFDVANVKVGEDLLEGLLQVDEARARDGWVATTSIEAGELVSRSDLREPAAPSEQRAMSFPIEAQRAVGGELEAGDRIDVISVAGGVPAYVAADLEVIAVDAPEGGGALSSGGTFGLTVAVNAEQALAVAQALSVGDVSVLRSTGAAVVDLPPPPPVSGGQAGSEARSPAAGAGATGAPAPAVSPAPSSQPSPSPSASARTGG